MEMAVEKSFNSPLQIIVLAVRAFTMHRPLKKTLLRVMIASVFSKCGSEALFYLLVILVSSR